MTSFRVLRSDTFFVLFCFILFLFCDESMGLFGSYFENCSCSLSLVFFVFFVFFRTKKKGTKCVFCAFLVIFVSQNKKQFSKTVNKEALTFFFWLLFFMTPLLMVWCAQNAMKTEHLNVLGP